MEQLVQVVKCNDDGTAQVIPIRLSACVGECQGCFGCGPQQFTANNPIKARLGQVVTVRQTIRPVLEAALMLCLMPLIMLFVGYIICFRLWSSGALGGCLGFVLGAAGAAVYDRRIAKKQTVYTITGFGHDLPEFLKKGDNDLD